MQDGEFHSCKRKNSVSTCCGHYFRVGKPCQVMHLPAAHGQLSAARKLAELRTELANVQYCTVAAKAGLPAVSPGKEELQCIALPAHAAPVATWKQKKEQLCHTNPAQCASQRIAIVNKNASEHNAHTMRKPTSDHAAMCGHCASRDSSIHKPASTLAPSTGCHHAAVSQQKRLAQQCTT